MMLCLLPNNYLNVKELSTNFVVSFVWIPVLLLKKSQHGCVRLAQHEHPTPPCMDFTCGRLEADMGKGMNHANRANHANLVHGHIPEKCGYFL